MKFFIYILSLVLLVGIIFYTGFIEMKSIKSKSIFTTLDIKRLKSSELLDFNIYQEEEESEKNKVPEEVVENITVETKDEVVIEEVSSSVTENSNEVLEIQVGSLSGYGPDCVGCSGFLASGMDVRGGIIYYADSTYGNVRILAGDRSYPYGTIVRVKNSKLSDFIGIVLDRGGLIGFGKAHLFDLLFTNSSEAANYGVSYDTTFEILRYGY